MDLDHFVDVLDPSYTLVRTRWIHGAIELLRQRAIEDIVDQRRFARTGDTCDDRQQTKWQRKIDILKIVLVRAKDLDGFAVRATALRWDGDASCATEIASRE